MKTLITFTLMLFNFVAIAFDAPTYFKQNCAACHHIGQGDKTGPDLAGVGKRRSVEWLVKYINYPDGMINGDEEEEGYEKPDAIAKFLYDGKHNGKQVIKAYAPNLMTENEIDEAGVKALIKYFDSVATTPKGRINEIQKKMLELGIAKPIK